MWEKIEQRTDEWFAARAGKATGSEMSKIMAHYGKPFGRPALALAERLAAERISGSPILEAGFANQNMTNGIILEPVAIRLYEETTFSTVTNGGFFNNGTHGASPDGLVGEEGVIEVKCGIASVHEERRKRWGIDSCYKWQTAHELNSAIISGGKAKWLDFVSYCHELEYPKNIIVFRVKASDKKFLEHKKKMELRLAEFEVVVLGEQERLQWR